MAKCPKCGLDKSVRKPGKGKTPFCEDCQRLRKNPKHYDINGVRFGTLGRVVVRVCHYCSADYERRKNELSIPVCINCIERHKVIMAPIRKEQHSKSPSARPEYRRQKRILKKLRKAGLPDDWFEKQIVKGCGICKSPEPGTKGWCIDHDHTHCLEGPGCKKCIRGVLCTPCNLALGLMKDDPVRLQKAIDWVTKPD